MKIKKILICSALLGALTLSGCGTRQSADSTAPDGTRPAILVVSFGTSYNDSRDKTIGAIETAIADEYPNYDVRRAFTSQIIIDKLRERDGLEIDNVEEALDRLVSDGVKELVVQPTHVMSGYEYDDLAAAVDAYKDKFDAVAMGAPLLDTEEDYMELFRTLTDETAQYDTDGTAIVFMGHGTEHEANAAYAELQQTFNDMGKSNYFIGTVEAAPTLDDIIAAVKAGGYTRVVLEPLMIVAGDHGSWKTEFEKAGFEVECVLKGMGEMPGVQQMYCDHVREAAAILEE